MALFADLNLVDIYAQTPLKMVAFLSITVPKW